MCSKAVVLVGGFGTRLRPLTYQVPKPLVPIAGEPLMDRILRRLQQHGFNQVTLAVQYLAEQFRAYYAARTDLGLELHIVEEPEPLGTAGAVRHAMQQQTLAANESILVLNGDELTTLDWRALCDYHREQAAVATIAVREVDDPSSYGVVVRDEQGRVCAWQEKPALGTARARTINSGAYVLNADVLNLIPTGQFAMFERELFPQLIQAGAALQTYLHTAYSQDTGTLDGYLAANAAVLHGHIPEYQPQGNQIAPGVWVGTDVQIDPSASLHAPIMLGSGTTVGPRTSLKYVVTWERVTIEADSFICKAAFASGCSVPQGTRIEHAAHGPQAAHHDI